MEMVGKKQSISLTPSANNLATPINSFSNIAKKSVPSIVELNDEK